MIHVKNLSKIFYQAKNSTFALHNINLYIKAGEVFGIIGKSGSGKSTLLRCLTGLEKACHGEIILDGVSLKGLSRHELRALRRRIGLIFQHFNLLNSRTVFENVALPLELLKEDRQVVAERVSAQLALVGLEDKANAYPEQLSGGQKQRVAIARALVTNPSILLCDEPTSALDPDSTRAILELLKEINHRLHITIVIVTHEMSVIKKICHEVAVMDQGKIIEQSTVLDLFTQPKSEISKMLTQEELNFKVPRSLKEQLQKSFPDDFILLVRLAFIGNAASEPVLYKVYEKFGVVINILQAELDIIDDASVGFMLCLLIGKPAQVAETIIYLKSLNVCVEVVGYE